MADKTEQLQQVMALYNVFGPEAKQDRELKQQALAAQLERTNAMRLGAVADMMQKQQRLQLESQRAQQMGPYYEALTQQALGGIQTPEERAAKLAGVVAGTAGQEATTAGQLNQNRVGQATSDSQIASTIAQNEAQQFAASQTPMQMMFENVIKGFTGSQYKSEQERQKLGAYLANLLNQQAMGVEGVNPLGTLTPEQIKVNTLQLMEEQFKRNAAGVPNVPDTTERENALKLKAQSTVEQMRNASKDK